MDQETGLTLLPRIASLQPVALRGSVVAELLLTVGEPPQNLDDVRRQRLPLRSELLPEPPTQCFSFSLTFAHDRRTTAHIGKSSNEKRVFAARRVELSTLDANELRSMIIESLTPELHANPHLVVAEAGRHCGRIGIEVRINPV